MVCRMKKFIIQLLSLTSIMGLLSCSTVNEPTKPSTWIAINNGLPDNTTITAITSVPGTRTLYTGTHDGVYKSINNGDLWEASSDGLRARDISCLAADNASQTVYAGTWGGGLYRSINGGESWHLVWSSDKNPHINALFISPELSIYAATEHGLFKSSNKGDSWSHIFNYGKIKTVAVHPQNLNVIYIGARWHGNLYSADGGATWQKINNGVYSTGQDVAAANRFVFDPKNPNHIFMSTGWVDLYQSKDGGQKWEQTGHQLADRSVASLAVRSGHSNSMWAITESDGVFISRDAGDSWSAFNEGLDKNKIKSMHISNSGSADVFVGTLGKGIYKYVAE